MGNLDYILLPLCIALSIGCEVILIYGFAKVKDMRKYPGIYFLIQSICLIIFDLHFLTSLGLANNGLLCIIIGAFWVSFYLLGWCCNFLISLEVYLKLLKIKAGRKRIFLTQIFLCLFWILNFVLIIFTNHTPKSNLNTCSIGIDSAYNWIMLFFTSFLSICIIVITILCYRIGKNNSMMQEVLKYHIYVAFIFILTLLPPTIISIKKSFKASQVIISIITYESALSGVFVFLVRALKAKFISKIFFKSKKQSKSYKNLNDLVLLTPYIQLLPNPESNIIELTLRILNLFYKSKSYPINEKSNLVYKLNFESQEYSLTEIEPLKFSKYKAKKLIRNEDLALYLINREFEIFENDPNFIARAKISSPSTFSYKTPKKQFILKSISKTEYIALNSFILNYIARSSKKSSFLQTICGLFKLHTTDQVLYLCILENPRKNFDFDKSLKIFIDDTKFFIPKNELLMTESTKSNIINIIKQDTKVFKKSFIIMYRLEYFFTEILNAQYKKSNMLVLENTIGYFYLKFSFTKSNPSSFSNSRFRDYYLERVNYIFNQQIVF